MSKTFTRSIFTTFLFLISIGTYAQLNFGVKGGLNVSSVHSERGGLTKVNPSVHLGLWFNFPVAKRWSAAIELLYSDKGFYQTHFSYVNVPLLAQYRVGKKLSIEAGPGFGYLTSVYTTYEGHSNADKIWSNKIDWELCLGVNYVLSERFTLGVRYEHGLSNVIGKDATTDDLYQIVPNSDVNVIVYTQSLRDIGYFDYNRNLQVSLLYRLSKLMK